MQVSFDFFLNLKKKDAPMLFEALIGGQQGLLHTRSKGPWPYNWRALGSHPKDVPLTWFVGNCIKLTRNYVDASSMIIISLGP